MTSRTSQKKNRDSNSQERLYLASQWQLIFRKFKQHKLAIIGTVVLGILYITSAFAEFIGPYDILERSKLRYSPPSRIRLVDESGRLHLRPFVYGMEKHRDPETWEIGYTEDTSERYPIRFFTEGASYKLWSLFPMDRHLFGVEEPGSIFLFGTDKLGRDLFPRTVYAARISLSIGLVGVAFSFVLGCIRGGISGYFGSKTDLAIQRIIEIFMSLPHIPLWIALAAALPRGLVGHQDLLRHHRHTFPCRLDHACESGKGQADKSSGRGLCPGSENFRDAKRGRRSQGRRRPISVIAPRRRV